MSISPALYLDDLARVTRIVDGDEDALVEFYRECIRRTDVLGRRARIPWQDRQDIAHNSFFTAIGQLERKLYRGESKLMTWLERIIHGKIAEYFRKQPPVIIETLNNPDAPELGAGASETSLTPVKAQKLANLCDLGEVEKTEVKIMVWETLDRMSVQHRTVLVLNRCAGYTPKEISEMSNIPVNQVRNRIYAAQDSFHRYYFEQAPPAGKKIYTPLPSSETDNEGDTHVKSRNYDSLTGVYRPGNETQDYGLLLRACRRIGRAFDRIGQAGVGGALARMRMLLAGSASVGPGSADVGYGSQFVADAEAR
jgi:RNA polymerase sigma factor (sigma-70 family)